MTIPRFLMRAPSGNLFLFTFLAFTIPGLAGASSSEEKILEYVQTVSDDLKNQESPKASEVRSVIEKLRGARLLADRLGLPAASSDASFRLAEAYWRLGFKFREKSLESFRYAADAAASIGDVDREIRALQGVLSTYTRYSQTGKIEPEDEYLEAFRRHADISVTSHGLLGVLASARQPFESTGEELKNEVRTLIGTLINGIDSIAIARLSGKTRTVSVMIRRFADSGLPLLAGKYAEEARDVDGLKRARQTHAARSDAKSELRVGLLLADTLGDGAETDTLRTELYSVALRAKDYRAAAELAPDEAAASALSALAGAQEDESADDSDMPAWQREGRRPDEHDVFVDTIVATIEGWQETYWGGVSSLIEFAHADGSKAFIPVYFDVLKGDPNQEGWFRAHEAAAMALSELAGPEHIDALGEALGTAEWEGRRIIGFALARMVKENPRIVDILESRLAVEDNEAVRSALRLGLAKSGRIRPHLAKLMETMVSEDDRAAVTAGVALFDLGLATPERILAKYGPNEERTDASADLSQLLGETNRPEAIGMLRKFADNGRYPYGNNAARSLIRFDTPAGEAARKPRLGMVGGTSTSTVWRGLRDGRRGRLSSKNKVDMLKKSKEELLEGRMHTADAAEWIVAEAEGEEVKFTLQGDIGDIRIRGQRLGIHGNEGRKPYPKRKPSNKPNASQNVHLLYHERLAAAYLDMTVRPIARLIDSETLVVNLRKEQSHAGMHKDQLAGPLWVNFELVLEAQDALRAVRLEGVAGAGGPLITGTPGNPMFTLPDSMPPGGLKNASLVLDIQFFGKKKELTFPLSQILILTEHDRPDLAISNIGIDPNPPRPGEPTEISFSVKNFGHQPSPPSELQVFVHNVLRKPKRKKIATKRVPRLVPGESIEMGVGAEIGADRYMGNYVPGWTPENRDTAIELVIDGDNVIEETDEKNNNIILPITLVLTDDEKSARLQEELLAQLERLADEIEALGPESPPERLQKALAEMLDALDRIRPRTPGIERARSLVRMLKGEAEARDQLKQALDKVKAATGFLEEEEKAKIAADLLEARLAFIDSGVPTSREHSQRLKDDIEAFQDKFGEDMELLDPEQQSRLDRMQKELDLSLARDEILGPPAISEEPDYEKFLGPDTDHAARESALEFLHQNDAWNENGLTMSEAAFDNIMTAGENPLSVEALDSFERAFEKWESSMPPGTEAQIDAISQGGENASASEAPTERGARAALKAIGW